MQRAETTSRSNVEVTRGLAAHASAITWADLPEEARTVAKQCLLDMIGVTLAGTREPLSEMLLAQIRDEGGAPHASLLGTDVRSSTAQAALFNGAAAHALDYDDVLKAFTGHPTVPVWPAVLAMAERRGLDGRAAIAAFCAGVEIEGRIGAMMGAGHYARGWHATGTIGTLGAAAAVANLLGFDAERTATALGIAGTQAAGLKAMFGTMCKPLHAGKAAQNGLFAAALAERGFTSRPNVLDCAQGFAATQADGIDIDAALAGIGARWHTPDVLFKYHAACYGVHAPVEAAIKLRNHRAFDPAAVERIDVEVYRACKGMCDIPDPTTGLEAKFSLAHNVALALTGQADGSLELYDDTRVAGDTAVAGLRGRVGLAFSDTSGPFRAEVVVRQKDGVVLRETHDVEIPERDLDRQWAKLERKFGALATPVIGEEQTARVVELCRSLDDGAGLDELTAACRA